MYKYVRKPAVSLVGAVFILAGGVMLVTPGPGWLAIVAGLAILANEYDWAHRLLMRARKRLHEARLKIQQRTRGTQNLR